MERVLIVGAGQAGFQAALSLREKGFEGRVSLIGDEPGLPYQRPPLSKTFLAGEASAEDVRFRPSSFYERHDVQLLLGERVTHIDRASQKAQLASGVRLAYDHVILAVGASPRKLRVPGAELDGVLYLRTLEDAQVLADRLRTARSAVVVGGGFVGLEFAAVASSLGVEVTVLEVMPRLLARATSHPISDFYQAQHASWGTTVSLGARVVRLEADGQHAVRAVELSAGQRVAADIVLVGIGAEPNCRLAAESGLSIDNGVVVDELLLTADPRISAIGDCANYPSHFAGASVRLESVQNAIDQARCVAARITGTPGRYSGLPWFWSDQRNLKLQLVGLTSGHDRVVVRGDPGESRFSVFCFRGDRLLGVDSVNRPADHMSARRLLVAAPNLVADLTPGQVSDEEFDLKAYVKDRTVHFPSSRPDPQLARRGASVGTASAPRSRGDR